MVKKPMGIWQRPLDFYVAFLVFLMGFYGLIDIHWPPLAAHPWVAATLIIEDIYLVIAGIAVMGAMALRRISKLTICSIVIEMFGWLFIAVAAAVIALTSFHIPPVVFVDPHPNDGLHWIHYTWIAIWAGLAISAFVRYLDMRRWWTRGGIGE